MEVSLMEEEEITINKKMWYFIIRMGSSIQVCIL